MILFLLIQAAAAQPATNGPPAPAPDAAARARWERCVDTAIDAPDRGISEATAWYLSGGGFLARQCLGMAYTKQQRWTPAGEAFEEAARGAEVARDPRSGHYWAQAGNAWIAAGTFDKAIAALNAALTTGRLTGMALGEAHLDRARVNVALGDNESARRDLNTALVHAADDPLAWLLSAVLARRMGDLRLARLHIDGAIRRSADDASVQLEAGNIAALEGNGDKAREAWTRTTVLAPGSEQAIAARAALAQFGRTATP